MQPCLERVVHLHLAGVAVISPAAHSIESPPGPSQAQAGPRVAERGQVVPLLGQVVKHLHTTQESVTESHHTHLSYIFLFGEV